MDEISKLSRLASGGVVLLNLVALLSPIRADLLEMPGGYRLEFIWHEFHWIKRPLNFEILFLIGAIMLFFGIAVHFARVVFKTRMLRWMTAAFAAQLVTSTIVDLSRVSHYHPPFHLHPWHAFAFIGGIFGLTSICVQAGIVIMAFRRKAHRRAIEATSEDEFRG